MYSFLFDQCLHEDKPEQTFSELSFSLFYELDSEFKKIEFVFWCEPTWMV